MTLPTFIVIGAAKSGTTSLAAYLRSHPDIGLAADKEPHFFSANWDKGIDWYYDQFAHVAAAPAIGEASTTYAMAPDFPETPSRIASVVPGVKLIYLIRFPVHRIRSQYAHNLDRALESRPLGEAIRRDPSYLDVTRYDMQIRRFLDHIPEEQLKVVVSEQLRAERDSTVRGILDFIGVDSSVELSDLDREHYSMAGKRMAHPLVNRGRRLARRLGFNRLLSREARRRLRSALTVEMPGEVVAVDDADATWILEALSDDIDLLRRRVDGLDAWWNPHQGAGAS